MSGKRSEISAEALTSLEQLTPDPKNARRHGQRNSGMVVGSLREVGAARSIVIDEDGTILAGNCTWEAANEIGMKRLQVVETDGNTVVAVMRKGLTPAQKKRLALLDNRSGELAEWDPAALLDEELLLDGLFSDDEQEQLRELAEIEARVEEGLDSEPDTIDLGSQWRVAVRPVLFPEQLDTFERAMKATGKRNRAEALTVLCEWYLISGAGTGDDRAKG